MTVSPAMEALGRASLPSPGPLLCVVGARPNFMKIAPIMRAFRQSSDPLPTYLVHTGQHYDSQMKDAFFDNLGIPEPDVDLGVGSGTHAVQTAEIMRRFEPVIEQSCPSGLLVVGDVNSTIACALVAAKRGIPVVHVEAGLRSFDRAMPEEINRILTDQLSDLLFTTEKSAKDNLLREGVDERRIHFVGNVMIDTLLKHREKAIPALTTIAEHAGAGARDKCLDGYAVLTLHRPSNVDDTEILAGLMHVVNQLSQRIPVVFAIHPRTQQRLESDGLATQLGENSRIFCIPPVGYLEMLGLMAHARVILTDSGGMQEESTALGVPCVTLRENTERPITVDQGTNTVVGTDSDRILAAVEDVLTTGGKSGRVPELWDGQASLRIYDIVREWLQGDRSANS